MESSSVRYYTRCLSFLPPSNPPTTTHVLPLGDTWEAAMDARPCTTRATPHPRSPASSTCPTDPRSHTGQHGLDSMTPQALTTPSAPHGTTRGWHWSPGQDPATCEGARCYTRPHANTALVTSPRKHEGTVTLARLLGCLGVRQDEHGEAEEARRPGDRAREPARRRGTGEGQGMAPRKPMTPRLYSPTVAHAVRPEDLLMRRSATKDASDLVTPTTWGATRPGQASQRGRPTIDYRHRTLVYWRPRDGGSVDIEGTEDQLTRHSDRRSGCQVASNDDPARHAQSAGWPVQHTTPRAVHPMNPTSSSSVTYTTRTVRPTAPSHLPSNWPYRPHPASRSPCPPLHPANLLPLRANSYHTQEAEEGLVR